MSWRQARRPSLRDGLIGFASRVLVMLGVMAIALMINSAAVNRPPEPDPIFPCTSRQVLTPDRHCVDRGQIAEGLPNPTPWNSRPVLVCVADSDGVWQRCARPIDDEEWEFKTPAEARAALEAQTQRQPQTGQVAATTASNSSRAIFDVRVYADTVRKLL